jgi:hypothetical protein
LFTHSIVHELWNCCHFFVIINNEAMKIFIQIFV